MRLEEKLKPIASRVDATVEDYFAKHLSDLNEPALHLLRAGGKRLRPCILVQSALSVGGDELAAYPFAAGVELLHNFTLIHDDIMDEDTTRHGVPSVHARWDVPTAILVGDFLFSTAFEIALMTPPSVPHGKVLESITVLAQAMTTVALGQSRDMKGAKSAAVSESDYLEMVKMKTAALYRAASRIGGLVGAGDADQVAALSEYGENSGIAFQIRDDLLGLIGVAEKLGKSVGSDIREGKRTLPVIYALDNSSEQSRRRLFSVLGNSESSKQDIEDAIDIVKDSGGLAYVKERQVHYLDKALQSLGVLPKTEARETLKEIAGFMASREY